MQEYCLTIYTILSYVSNKNVDI